MRFLNLEYFFLLIRDLLTGRGDLHEQFAPFLSALLDLIRALFTYAALIFITGAIYSLIRIRQLREEQKEALALSQSTPEKRERNERWERISEMILSDNQSDWKQAIIEADAMLLQMMTRMGYHGDTLGDKLKSVERSDFLSIDKAWEAHKVRNKIAHEGSDFILTEREAGRILSLYEDVFKEFGFI